MANELFTFDEETAVTLRRMAGLFARNGGRFEGVKAEKSPPSNQDTQSPIVHEVRVALPTTSIASAISSGTQTVSPASMTDIYVGSMLLIDSAGTPETVTVTAITGSTFTAVFADAHASTPVSVQAVANSFGYPCRIRQWNGTAWADAFAPAQVIDPNGATLANNYCDLARLVRREIDGSLTYVIAAVQASGGSIHSLGGQMGGSGASITRPPTPGRMPTLRR